jgi:hypothetical protein
LNKEMLMNKEEWIRDRSAILEFHFGFSREDADREASKRYKNYGLVENDQTLGDSDDLLVSRVLADRPDIEDI